MGIKVLFSFLSVVVGISMSGYFISSIAMGHEYRLAYSPTGAVAMFYLALFIGIAITVIGCILACTKKKDIGLTISLIVLSFLAIIFQIVSLALIQNYMARENGFVMIIILIANASIVTLANIYLIQTLLNKGGSKDGN